MLQKFHLSSQNFLVLILGISHGIADATAGFILGNLVTQMSLEQVTYLIIIYNILGFGYQPIAGLIIDQSKCPKLAVVIGLSGLGIGIILNIQNPLAAIIFAGLGSAFFHVSGGALSLAFTNNKIINSAIFTAPGVLGLTLGVIGGLSGINLSVILLISLLLMIVLISLQSIQIEQLIAAEYSEKLSVKSADENDLLLLILLTAIALTSTVWTSFQFLLQSNFFMLINCAISATLCKIAGGFLATKYGTKPYLITILFLATLLLKISTQHPLFLILALGLLQSTIPLTLIATLNLMPNQPATASSLALGLAIIIGGIPVIFGSSEITSNPSIASAIIMFISLLLWWLGKQKILVD